MYKNIFVKGFLLFLVIGILYLCYKIFAPFLDEILISAVLVSIFYRPYEYLVKVFRGHKHLAALVMCFVIILIVIIPFTNFVIYAAEKSIVGYGQILGYAERFSLADMSNNHHLLEKAQLLGINQATIKEVLVDLAKKTNDWLVGGAASLIKGATSFFVSVALVLFTMFFFFVDGESMLDRLMYLTPLPNRYDKSLFSKFRSVSYSTIVSSFVVAVAQGLIGAFGFWVAGLPVFFSGIALAFSSLLPYFGTGLVWMPAAIYLFATGRIWEGTFLVVWGLAVVGTVDNLIRAYMIKGKAEVHPIFLIFSIIGGIAFFGFWGVVFGPLIISLAVTILDIYEMEYESVLEK